MEGCHATQLTAYDSTSTRSIASLAPARDMPLICVAAAVTQAAALPVKQVALVQVALVAKRCQHSSPLFPQPVPIMEDDLRGGDG